MKRIYMDNAATTAMSDHVIDEMARLQKEFYGNPSSMHTEGTKAFSVIDGARKKIAACFGCEPNEIYFTSGGSESDNWALKGAAELMAKKGKKHIISTTIEHHAILHALDTLKKQGFEVTLVPVNAAGFVSAREIESAMRDDTGLVTVMYANNEIGTIQPISEIGALCCEKKILFHTDAVQAVGHININVRNENIDMLSLSAHKFHGPNGIGALYLKKGIALPNLIDGGGQERGRRAGTENVAAAHAMALALEDCLKNIDEYSKKMRAIRDKLIDGALKIERSRLNGSRENRLDGNVSLCFEGVEGEALLLSLDMYGIAASSGSACTSGSLDPSHVLLALGMPHEIAHGSLRLSLCETNTLAEADKVLEVLPQIINKLRDMSPVWERIIKGDKYGI
ncbi:MAG: cysteine desulfurase NifS [Clostridia bacterium]